MKINLFGRIVLVTRSNNQWRVFYLGNEGKRRPANDIRIPADIAPEKVPDYLADLCHEWATPSNGEVKILDN